MEAEDEPEDEHAPYYPYTLADDGGNKHTIVDTVCFKFMQMDMKINGKDSVIDDRKVQEMTLPVECRLRVLRTNNNEHIIVINDDIYHIMPMVIEVNNPNYIYVRFADAVSYCKELGYKDMTNKGQYQKALERNTRLKNMKIQEWWGREKKKIVIL